MGWCAELGPEIQAGCRYSMIAHHDHCSCEHCGATCHGLFAACKAVWAAGPRPVVVRSERDGALMPRGRPATEGDEGRLVLNEPARRPDVGSPPQISLIPGTSAAIGAPSAPAGPQDPSGRSTQVVSRFPLEDVVRQLQAALDEAVASIHLRLDELEDRFKKLQLDNSPPRESGVKAQLSEVQGALANLMQQTSYLERVLAGLRADVASIVVLQRQASHR